MHIRTYMYLPYIFTFILSTLWLASCKSCVFPGGCVESRRNIVHNQHVLRPSPPLCGGYQSYSYPLDQVSTKSSLYDEFLVHDLHVVSWLGTLAEAICCLMSFLHTTDTSSSHFPSAVGIFQVSCCLRNWWTEYTSLASTSQQQPANGHHLPNHKVTLYGNKW